MRKKRLLQIDEKTWVDAKGRGARQIKADIIRKFSVPSASEICKLIAENLKKID